ncbi:MAG: hypothetical protein JSU83_05795 [Deltaproteobacteria bacterium]|nr:MAG: hypothetical protein JSU83_05795 [Deltaproteobacteria bacterium]
MTRERYKSQDNHGRKTIILTFFILTVMLPPLLLAGKITELSKKASSLKIGISRQSVINLLGPPTWAVIPGDKYDFTLPNPRIKLELYWKNPGCSPVIVQFNAKFKVCGWDEGRIYCGKEAYLFEPAEEYLCDKPDRTIYCK